MKKIILTTLVLILINATMFGQSEWDKYEAIKSAKSVDPKVLSLKITEPYDDELDKIRAIYYWIGHNIKYDYSIVEQRAKDSKGKSKKQRYSPEALKEKKALEIKTALKKKKGVCQHYSRIFEALCTHSNIESEFIRGTAKSYLSKSSSMGDSHAWNAVKYNGEWQLLDITFGSGGLDDKKKFVANFDPNYLFVDKDVFILNHYPKDSKWQMTEKPVEAETFKNYISIGRGFLEYKVSDLNKMERKIELPKKDDLIIEFKTEKPLKDLYCFKIGAKKRVDIEIEENNLNYKIKIDPKKLSKGKYLFSNGKKMLFSYLIVK